MPPEQQRKLIGDDFKKLCNDVADQLERELPEKLAREREAAEKFNYTGRQAWLCKVEKTAGYWTATTLEHPPMVGQLQARGRNAQHALNELRIVYARTLHQKKIILDWSDCLEYCVNSSFKPDLTI